MTTSGKSVKAAPAIVIDPNFFLPPDVVDMRYFNLEDEGDSKTMRGEDGEVILVEYDDVWQDDEDADSENGTGTVSPIIATPDSMTIISQTVRVTSDGKFVVDVVLEVDDIAGVVQYDVRLTKP